MIATLDTVSGGRIELGIGAGWKRDEWLAYGYGFPDTSVRLAILRDQLEVITRMIAPGREVHATFLGPHASVVDAINLPKPLQQPRVPVIVGGNGPEVTWRLAARFADELNLDGLAPLLHPRARDDPRQGRRQCGPELRDVGGELERRLRPPRRRVDRLAAYRELGVARIQTLLRDSPLDHEAVASFAADCRAAGATLETPTVL